MGAHVTQIPGIMRANGLNTGARTMSRWFGFAAHSNSLTAAPQFDLVSMDFVRGFSGPRADLTTAIAQKRWLTPNAKIEIMKMLHKRGLLTGDTTEQFFFDNANGRNPTTMSDRTWKSIDSDYIQYVTLGSQYSAIDDFKATLGRGTVRFLISGAVSVLDGTATVSIDKVGIYVRDSYDFDDDADAWFSQPLGYWEAHTDYVGRRPMVPTCEMQFESRILFSGPGGYQYDIQVPAGVECFSSDGITNSDFRAYRTRSGKGGDFLILSEIEHHDTSDTFTFPTPAAGWGTL